MKYERPQSFELDWREFGVDIGLAMAHIKELSPSVKAYTGSRSLILWLSAPLTDEEIGEIRSYWASLSIHHAHCRDYKSRAQRIATLDAAKLAAANKTWDQMSAAERKLTMGLELNSAEMKSLG